ncbi:MAG: mechanosensitive ion channel [Flavobacteriaceae bacterium]|nr:mechanosensitive ion channel [Flavobacteriaceae bacterium]
MELKTQIILIASATVVLFILMAITKRITKKVSSVKELDPNRKKVVLNAFYFLFYLVFIVTVIIILGIDLKELSIFISSVLAILGIALFAQWSLLSSLTASIIIFFYHPLKIGDKVKILDKEFDFSGTVTDITGFYVMIKTDEDHEISIPNSLVLQKGIKFLNKVSKPN